MMTFARRLGSIRIRTKMLAFTVIVGVVFVAVGYLSFSASESAVTETYFGTLRAIREAKQHQISEYFRRASDVLVLAASTGGVVELIARGSDERADAFLVELAARFDVFDKLGVDTRAAATACAIQKGWL